MLLLLRATIISHFRKCAAAAIACWMILFASFFFAASCSSKRVAVARPRAVGFSETGIASWYGEPYHGRRTANGEVYDMHRWTAAHRTMPFNTWIEVRNLNSGKTVHVRINDRGPFIEGRIIDLSRAAAEKIDMMQSGIARVRLTVIQPPSDEARQSYAVQVGAFEDEKRAGHLMQTLRVRQTRPVRVVRRDAAHSVYRVLVGEEDAYFEASLLASSLRSEFPDAIVVRVDEPNPSAATGQN